MANGDSDAELANSCTGIGTSLYVYGGSGPEYGNYTLTIDPSIPTPFIYPGQAYSQQNGTDRYLLYGTDGLAYAEHEVVIETQGGRFLLDLVEVGGLEFGAEGFVLLLQHSPGAPEARLIDFDLPFDFISSQLQNITLDDNSPEITYNGTWITNQVDLFWGGSSIYTATPGDSFSFDMEGSAFYVYGDQVNDHGAFSVYADDQPLTQGVLSGRSGCGGEDSKSCEKLGGLHFFAGGLGEGKHTVRVVNEGSGPNAPYFGEYASAWTASDASG